MTTEAREIYDPDPDGNHTPQQPNERVTTEAREKLVETMAFAVWGAGRQEWQPRMMRTALDAILADPALVLEALGAERWRAA